jgi:hypothetical protein
MRCQGCGRVRWIGPAFRPGPQSGSRGRWLLVEQISPDKDVGFRCTTAPFTVSPGPQGFVMLC